MEKKELEQMFFEKFDINSEWTSFWMEDYTKFIFETIIPEVLNSIIYSANEMKTFKMVVNEKYFLWLNFYDENLKQRAKEKFWINL